MPVEPIRRDDSGHIDNRFYLSRGHLERSCAFHKALFRLWAALNRKPKVSANLPRYEPAQYCPHASQRGSEWVLQISPARKVFHRAAVKGAFVPDPAARCSDCTATV